MTDDTLITAATDARKKAYAEEADLESISASELEAALSEALSEEADS